MTDSAILLIQCKDQQGIVAAVSGFLFSHHGNILEIDQHIEEDIGYFFMRVKWELKGFALERDSIAAAFEQKVAGRFRMNYKLHFNLPRPRMAIFVSKLSHCLFDILSRHYSGEFEVDIPLIISNHTTLEPVAEGFRIPFCHFPISSGNKAEQEQKQLALLHKHKIDFVVLARYMQILSPDFISHFPNRVINIHHSFLPAFVGARPYHAAHKRGVKIIGATAHYVTEELDAGPIIEQDIARVRHHNSVANLVQMGQDVEKLVLSKAIQYHIARKVMVMGSRTVIFT